MIKLFKISIFRPKFRSYKPQDENLKSNVLEDARPGDVESVVREQLDAASSKVVIEELVSYRTISCKSQIYSCIHLFSSLISIQN